MTQSAEDGEDGQGMRGEESRGERDSPGRCSLALVGHFRRYWHALRTRAHAALRTLLQQMQLSINPSRLPSCNIN